MLLAEVFEYIRANKSEIFLKSWMLGCFGNLRDIQQNNIHIDNYNGHPIAKLHCLNVMREIKFENIPPQKLREILLALDNHIERNTISESSQTRTVQNFSCSNDDCLCQGNQPDMAGIDDISRVMTADDIIFYCYDPTGLQPFNEEVNSPQIAKELEERLRDSTTRNLPVGFFTTSLPLFWFTKGDDLRQFNHIPPSSEKANKIRNALGLARMEEGYAIEIQFKKKDLERASTPSYFDSGPNNYFCTILTNDNWGRTRRLPTLEVGLSEAVHDKINWPSQFMFNFLGELSFPPLPDKDNYNELVTHLWHELNQLFPDFQEELIIDLQLPI